MERLLELAYPLGLLGLCVFAVWSIAKNGYYSYFFWRGIGRFAFFAILITLANMAIYWFTNGPDRILFIAVGAAGASFALFIVYSVGYALGTKRRNRGFVRKL